MPNIWKLTHAFAQVMGIQLYVMVGKLFPYLTISIRWKESVLGHSFVYFGLIYKSSCISGGWRPLPTTLSLKENNKFEEQKAKKKKKKMATIYFILYISVATCANDGGTLRKVLYDAAYISTSCNRLLQTQTIRGENSNRHTKQKQTVKIH